MTAGPARRPRRPAFAFAPSLALLFALVTGLALPPSCGAHRLSDCLQAARIDVAPDRLTLELDLSPGLGVAPRFIALIDVDRDGQISELEADAYADRVCSELAVTLDGRSMPLRAGWGEIPTVEELQSGLGLIRLTFTADVPPLRPGLHRLHFRNRHQTPLSVHLANALQPDSPRVRIVRQSRDPDQRELTIRFELR